MKTITWDFNSYIIDNQPSFMISGEFHYFRVPKSDWRKRLELWKEAGGNCVATYIPWLIHESEEGKILFGDVPERDLEGFLQLCREMDLLVVCRPGPYQYSEMKYDGLPGWLCENYPEIHARNVQGQPFRKASVSYLHPVFLAKVKTWYDTVCPILARYTPRNGGPMAFAQIDNEMMGIHYWFSGGWDYHPETMGFGWEEGRYPRFLKNRYQTVAALNKAYATGFQSFAAVTPFTGSNPRSLEERRRVKDYQDFYFESIAEYAEILVRWMREAGIDCPIVHNSPNPASNSQFLETVTRLGTKKFVLGSDHYYTLGPDWEQNNPTPQYASKVFYSNEMLRLMGYPATVFELPGGSASNWPPVTPEDFRCCYYTNLALGMKGLNYYIFTGGPNPFDCGAFSDSYDYGAAIGAGGEVRPIYEVQREFGAFLTENPWLARAERVADFHIGLIWEDSRSAAYFQDAGETLFSPYQAWEFMRRGMMISAHCSSVAPNLLDLETEALLEYIDQPLWVATSAVMPAAVQRRLIAFVQKGGKLLLAPVIPVLDEKLEPCTLLRDFLGGASLAKCEQYAPVFTVGTVRNVFDNGGIFLSVDRPIEAETIAREELSGVETGWKKEYDGGGMVLWLGFHWKHSMFEHGRMLRWLLREMGCPEPVVECDNPNLWTSLRSDGNRWMLFVMNLYSSPMQVGLRVKEGRGYRDLGTHTLAPMEVKIWEV